MNNETTTIDPPIPPPKNPSSDALKAVLLITLFVITFLACIGALFLKQFVLRHHSRRFTKAFSYISVFGGGVFLATCLLDLLPDSIEEVEKGQKLLVYPTKLPLAEVGVAIGFILVLLIEQLILHANENKWLGDSETRLLGHHEIDDPAAFPSEVPNTSEDFRHEEWDGNAGDDSNVKLESHSTIRVILLVFALSLHSVFEGFSVGMIEDVNIFFALIIHKTVIGFSLGIRLAQTSMRPLVITICCITFAGQVLIGGFSGLAIMDFMNTGSKGATSLVSGGLQAVACGTFLYITCFEILPHELSNREHRLLKMLMLILGFCLIVFFIIIFPDAG